MRYRHLGRVAVALSLVLLLTAAGWGVRARHFPPKSDRSTFEAKEVKDLSHSVKRIEEAFGPFIKQPRVFVVERLPDRMVEGLNEPQHIILVGEGDNWGRREELLVLARLQEVNPQLDRVIAIGIAAYLGGDENAQSAIARHLDDKGAMLSKSQIRTCENTHDSHVRASAQCVIYYLHRILGKELQEIVSLTDAELPEPGEVHLRVVTFNRVLQEGDWPSRYGVSELMPQLFKKDGLLPAYDAPWPINASDAVRSEWVLRCKATGAVLFAAMSRDQRRAGRWNHRLKNLPPLDTALPKALAANLNEWLVRWGANDYQNTRLPLPSEITNARNEELLTRREAMEAERSDALVNRAKRTARVMVHRLLTNNVALRSLESFENTKREVMPFNEIQEPATVGPKPVATPAKK